jgi:hypothetical protein
MGASEEQSDTSASRAKAVALLSAAVWCSLLAGGGRTGAVGGTNRVARSSAGPCHGSPRVSTKSLGESQRRMTRLIEAPQVGQQATRGGGGLRWGGGVSLEWACTIRRRTGASGRVPLACRKPKWRTCIKPSGKTCCRHRRRHSMTSRWVVRGRGLPPCREVQVTVRSLSETRRRLAMATVKTEGAR